MNWLNYHHLYYFWVTAREGSIARACTVLHLSQPTISGQIHDLQRAMGVTLFSKSGRGLALTDTGRLVFRYADEIFSLGREMSDAVQGRPVGRPLVLRVGILDALPKMVAYQLIAPALRIAERPQIQCVEGTLERLAADLVIHKLDVVLSDSPLPTAVRAKVFNHQLGECGILIVSAPSLAKRLRKDFPRSLAGAPFLLPSAGTSLRDSLGQWFDALGIRPEVRGEFDDGALMKIFGRAGVGAFAIPSCVEKDVRSLYGIQVVGTVTGVTERFYAISVERKLKHPAVVAISEMARKLLVN